jgi:hypothetical protein
VLCCSVINTCTVPPYSIYFYVPTGRFHSSGSPRPLAPLVLDPSPLPLPRCERTPIWEGRLRPRLLGGTEGRAREQAWNLGSCCIIRFDRPDELMDGYIQSAEISYGGTEVQYCIIDKQYSKIDSSRSSHLISRSWRTNTL